MFYANGVEMLHEDFGRGWGVRFIGSKGTIDISRDYFESNPTNLIKIKDDEISVPLYIVVKDHYQDWLDAIKTRNQPICNVEIGHRSATVCNIANIGYQLGRSCCPSEASFSECSLGKSLESCDHLFDLVLGRRLHFKR